MSVPCGCVLHIVSLLNVICCILSTLHLRKHLLFFSPFSLWKSVYATFMIFFASFIGNCDYDQIISWLLCSHGLRYVQHHINSTPDTLMDPNGLQNDKICLYYGLCDFMFFCGSWLSHKYTFLLRAAYHGPFTLTFGSCHLICQGNSFCSWILSTTNISSFFSLFSCELH